MEIIIISLLYFLRQLFLMIALWIMPSKKGDRVVKQLNSLRPTFSFGKILDAFIEWLEYQKSNKDR